MRASLGILCFVVVAMVPVAAQSDSEVVLADGDALLRGNSLFPAGMSPECELSIGTGQGVPGSMANSVAVSLSNNVAVTVVQFAIADTPNVLTASGCTALPAGFSCVANDDGTIASISFTPKNGDTVPAGSGVPILEVLYNVDPVPAAGPVSLVLQDITVTTEDGGSCAVTGVDGIFDVLPSAECGNGEVEEGEECDDGNTDDGDCCSSTCMFEEAGSSCDDGMFCTVDDTCDGAGTCESGGPRDCDDDDICTNDSCDEELETCVNEFDETNDPSCPECASIVTIGMGSGTPDSTGNLVPVSLTNNQPVQGLLFDIVDDPNVLSVPPMGCNSLVGDFGCTVSDDGTSVSIVFVSLSDALLSPGTDVPILELQYDVAAEASAGTVTLSPQALMVSDENDEPCEAAGVAGSFVVEVGAECGNGEVEEGEECDDGNTDDGDCCSSTCMFEEAGSSCDDGMFCTEDDTCDGAGTCESGGPRDCDDDDICTNDSCDEELETCVNEFDETNDPSCPECASIVTIGMGSGTPDSTGNPVPVSLTNNQPVRGLQLDVIDDPNVLSVPPSGCNALVDDFACSISDDGTSVSIVFVSVPGALLSPGSDVPIFELQYDVAAEASAGTVTLSPQGLAVSDENNEPCEAMGIAGSFVVRPECGNGEVEEGEECDDGNTDDGDCCSSTCMFEEAGSPCDDGMFCTEDDTCDGAGTCESGGPRDCDDEDICTNDSCDEELESCVNEFDETNDPSCPECASIVTIGMGSGTPDSTGNPVPVSLTNNQPVRGVQFVVVDDPNVLSVPPSGCSSLVDDFGCIVSDDGPVSINFGSLSDALLSPGTDVAIFELEYDVAADASAGMVTLSPLALMVPLEDGKPCEATGIAGSFVVEIGAECGNGEVEEGEECDDGNTDDGDCCSSTCMFEEAGSSCDDGMFCTVDDTCDGAGTCESGGPRDCDDDDICTNDSCDEELETCVNEFDETNDPSCPECASIVAIGMGSGTPDSTGNLVPVSMTNNQPVQGLLFDIVDDPNVLSVPPMGCNSLVDDFGCTVSDDGTSVSIAFVSLSDALLSPGTDVPILELQYDVAAEASAGTVTLSPQALMVSDENDEPCEAAGVAGSFVVEIGAECGNGEVEEGEECDDGNTDDGDCCSSTCMFEEAGSPCDDGMFCTEDDTCDGAGTCESGGPRDCDDDDICTNDSCDEELETCVNEFDETNDPSCPECASIVTIGMGSGAPESTGNLVPVSLTNNQPVRGLLFDIVDDPNVLSVPPMGCNSLVDDFGCTVSDDGTSASIVFVSLTAALLSPGTDVPILELEYDVAADASDGTVTLSPLALSVSDENSEPCDATGVAGSFVVEEAECGNGEVEEGEECDDGNTDDGDCCSSTCMFEEAGSPCDDGMFCTEDDTCDGAGTCESGGPRDCDDDDICTNDSCDEDLETCVNEFDETNDPSCECASIVTIGMGSGAPDSTGNPVPVSLTNNQPVRGVLFDIVDDPNVLSVPPMGCNSLVDEFGCNVSDDGTSATIVFVSLTAALLSPGTDVPIFELQYDVAAEASAGTVTLSPQGLAVSDENNEPCEAMGVAGSFDVPPVLCGNGEVEEGEECDDGNTDDGDCCSSTCMFEEAGSPCDDGFCTVDDTCDGAGTCESGGPRDCDDEDICTNDSCDEELETCVNEFDETLDPTCRGARLTRAKSCAFIGSSPEVCFDFAQATDDGMPGGPDDITAIDWCLTWDTDELMFDCTDDDDDGIPDAFTFLIDDEFTSIVNCDLANPECRLRISILGTSVPLPLLPDDTLACMVFNVQEDAGGDGMLELPISESSSSDTMGTSLPVDTVEDSLAFDDCCVADCNADQVVDIADAVSVILELSDLDGDDFCDTDLDVPFDGSSCCDCNTDTRIDIADAVCIVNGLGQFECPTGMLGATDLFDGPSPSLGRTEQTSQGSRQTDQAGREDRRVPDAGLTVIQQPMGEKMLVPVMFKQDRNDRQAGGLDEISAVSFCLDFDQGRLALDLTDRDRDGTPDAIRMLEPAGHSAFVNVDLTRDSCEVHISVIDFSQPSSVLPNGALAEIEFEHLTTDRGICVSTGSATALSFADVLGRSLPGKTRTVQQRP